jgi:proteasome alpha subunit
VEILVAEVGVTAVDDQLYHVLYDGSVLDEDRLTVLGGEAEAITERMQSALTDGWPLGDALRAARLALAGPDRELDAAGLEVAVLSRVIDRRAFRRIADAEVAELLAAG